MPGLQPNTSRPSCDLLWYDYRRIAPGRFDRLAVADFNSWRYGTPHDESFSEIALIMVVNSSIYPTATLKLSGFGDSLNLPVEANLPDTNRSLIVPAGTARLLISRLSARSVNEENVADLWLENVSTWEVRYRIAILGKSRRKTRAGLGTRYQAR